MINAEGYGLTCQCCSDVGWHIIITFVVMGIETTPAFTIDRTFSVLWYDSVHPGLQVFEYAWIGILIDCEAGAGVQTSEMQHACFDGRFGDQVVQAFVESCKPRAVG